MSQADGSGAGIQAPPPGDRPAERPIAGALDFITVVSGLPRSGTSMMMQVLEAGGMPALMDGVREADEDNPRGYYETEGVKRLKSDASWLDQAAGRVIKVVSMLLYDLPPGRDYRVVFLLRRMEEILASQAAMLRRRGQPQGPDDSEMAGHYERHLSRVRAWLSGQNRMRVLYCDYNAVLAEPARELAAVREFLGGSLDMAAMLRAVDPRLYRQRGAQ